MSAKIKKRRPIGETLVVMGSVDHLPEFKSVNSNCLGTALIAIYVSVNLANLPLKIWTFLGLFCRRKMRGVTELTSFNFPEVYSISIKLKAK